MSLFEKVKTSVNKIKEEKGVPVPVSAHLINELIKKTDKIKETTVEITTERIVIGGKAEVEKLLIKQDLEFSISLEPVKMEGREMSFRIEQFKPINLNFINKNLFNKPPHISYDGNYLISLHFNSWDIVQKVPFGNIKNYQLSDGKLILLIGI